jgi:endonuclease IV
MKLADGTKVGNHPDFIRAFAKMAEFRSSVTSEDTVSDSAQTSLQSRQSAQQEIQAIMHGPNYMNRKDPVARQAAIDRVNELMSVLHGTE